jgi:hypothetical protein
MAQLKHQKFAKRYINPNEKCRNSLQSFCHAVHCGATGDNPEHLPEKKHFYHSRETRRKTSFSSTIHEIGYLS